MRTRMYGGVRGRKTKVGGKPTFVFLLLDLPMPTTLKSFMTVWRYGKVTPSPAAWGSIHHPVF